MNGQIPGQMSLFDFVKPVGKYPAEVQELENKLFFIFKGHHIRNTGYRIWQHVPIYGYRYEAFIEKCTSDEVENIDDLDTEALEVSINVIPDYDQTHLYTLFVSTIWKEKKRRNKW